VVGNIGSELRSKYAVVGHHVNLTGRIESFTVGNQILASEFTVAEVGESIRLGRQFQVDAKGLREPITLHEVLGIGHPFHLDLNQQSEPLETLSSPLEVEFVELADKKLDGPRTGGRIVALADSLALLDSDRPLELMANLRLNIKNCGQPASGDFYAKVTECKREHKGERYQVTFTSMPDAVREHLTARRSQSEANP
jgi:adenylate cyclase